MQHETERPKTETTTLPTRVPLHAPETLRWIMQHPGRGTPYTVRELASAVACSPATISHLLTGRYRRTEATRARLIAEELGCEQAALFAPMPSTDPDDTSMI